MNRLRVLLAVLLMMSMAAAAPARAPAATVSAFFGSAVGVYVGSDVRVLGVKVGEIEAVVPQGDKVRVDFSLDDGVRAPADAKAAVVAPALVAERYIQLTPAYTGGPALKAGDTIALARTAVPMELDALYDATRELADALGPKGTNKKGAVSHFLDTSAANLDGNGKDLGTLIAEFGKASKTLADSSPDLFATVKNLADVSSTLRANDGQVRQLEQQLAEVSGFLAEDRGELAGALKDLGVALGEVKGFVHDNRKQLAGSVNKLAEVTQTLVDRRDSLAETLDNIPLALDNVYQAYDPSTGSLMGRGDLLELMFGPGARPPGDTPAATPTPTDSTATASPSSTASPTGSPSGSPSASPSGSPSVAKSSEEER